MINWLRKKKKQREPADFVIQACKVCGGKWFEERRSFPIYRDDSEEESVYRYGLLEMRHKYICANPHCKEELKFPTGSEKEGNEHE